MCWKAIETALLTIRSSQPQVQFLQVRKLIIYSNGKHGVTVLFDLAHFKEEEGEENEGVASRNRRH